MGGFLLGAPALEAQTITAAQPGPVIAPWGPVFQVEGMDVPVDLDRDYYVVFDVSQSPTGLDGVNPYLETAARFLNMHARAGVPLERMRVAVVLHGSAGKDALQEGPYEDRFDAQNPNADMIRALAATGVEFYMCGQTAMSRNLPAADLLPEIRMALSAMTARAMLRARGYEIVN
ncbi:MAG: DsrE family protein [Gemmatimonadota bacterium]